MLALLPRRRLEEDLRGRFVLINEDNGEVVGALDGSVRVHEDPSLGERGHEKDPVVVELPDDADMLDDSKVLVCAIPPKNATGWSKGPSSSGTFASLSMSSSLTLQRIQPCHLGDHHSPHERNDKHLELLHRAYDARRALTHATLIL
jgi:hypothetical protein